MTENLPATLTTADASLGVRHKAFFRLETPLCEKPRSQHRFAIRR
jgi:hypothetical protein